MEDDDGAHSGHPGRLLIIGGTEDRCHGARLPRLLGAMALDPDHLVEGTGTREVTIGPAHDRY